VVLLEQPALWKDGLSPELEALLWMGGVGEYTTTDRCEYYTSAALARGLARYNSVVRAVGTAEDAQVIALSDAISGQPRYFYDDVHFTEEGAREVAAIVADTIASQPPLAPAGKGSHE